MNSYQVHIRRMTIDTGRYNRWSAYSYHKSYGSAVTKIEFCMKTWPDWDWRIVEVVSKGVCKNVMQEGCNE